MNGTETQAGKAGGIRFGKKVASPERLLEMVEEVTEIARRMFNAAGSSVLLLDTVDNDLVFKVATGKAGKQLIGKRISCVNGIAGWIAVVGEPLIVNDVSKDWRFNKTIDTVTDFITKSVMCAPLIDNHGRVIGVIEVVNKLDRTIFKDDDLEALKSLAHVAVLPLALLINGTGSGNPN